MQGGADPNEPLERAPRVHAHARARECAPPHTRVATCEQVNVKTRAAAFEFLLGLTAAAERRASGEQAKAEAVRAVLVMVAGGLAANTPHMMAASLAALGRLTFELREKPALQPTVAQLFATVLALLKHKAQEVASGASRTLCAQVSVCTPRAPCTPHIVAACMCACVCVRRCRWPRRRSRTSRWVSSRWPPSRCARCCLSSSR